MSVFTKGKWVMDTKIKRVSCAVWRTIRKADSNIESNDNIAYIPQVRCNISEEEALANARLIASAPEMYHMIAYLLGYVREWEAVSSGTIYKAKVRSDIQKAEALLKRIDGKEAQS